VNDDTLQEVTEIAATVAKQIHPRYAVYFEPQDLRQELLVWALKRPDKINEWLGPDVEVKDRKAGIRQLAKSMQREADKYCRHAKAKASGYEARDEYYYNQGILEELIANLDEANNQTGGMQARVSGGGGDPATGNNFAASIVDVRRAMEELEPQDQLMLEMRYAQDYTYSQIANILGLSDTTTHRRVEAAMKRMVKFLGGENPWVGTRRVVSNATARAVTSEHN
jgi:RNA polymerase sigma factor (sigma-70 family)